MTDREKLAPYLSAVIAAADESGIDRALIAAQGFRESGWTWARGYTPQGDPRGYGDWMARRGHWLKAPGSKVVDPKSLAKPWRVPDGDDPVAIPDDGQGWGRGLLQLDWGTYHDQLSKLEWWKAEVMLRAGCAHLRNDLSYLRTLVSMPGVDPELLLRTVFAAYNCGPTNARRGLALKGNPDAFTAGADYSAWIWAKAADLRVQIPELSHTA